MAEYSKSGNLSRSALRADMSHKTARKYIKAGKLPSQMPVEHSWRTRKDPFAEDWLLCEALLTDAPELEAKTIFEYLCDLFPGRYQDGQLRTLQRRIADWRALHGRDKEVYFPQVHTPGKRMSTDCTHADELGVTIQGEAFAHLLCHCVLTCSNWEWATICHSESLLALRRGIQAALFQLGHVPLEHWTDHSSAATHVPAADEGPGRKFNQGYLDIMEHFGMKPQTIQVDSPHENGDVESLNGALKRRLKQYLLLRGSSDFDSIEEYRDFLESVLRKVNATRSGCLEEELKSMPLLKVSKLAEYEELVCTVRSSCTISVKRRIYSLPSRLIGCKVVVRQYEDHIQVFYNKCLQLTAPWLGREKGHHINYRHIIKSLIRKPGAFRNYRYREELFPGEIFRWAFDSLAGSLSEKSAERDYLQLLNLAADTMQCEVEKVLSALRNREELPRFSAVLKAVPVAQNATPSQVPFKVDLCDYDELCSSREVSA